MRDFVVKGNEGNSNMYIVKDHNGNIIKEYSRDNIKPGAIMYLSNKNQIRIITRDKDYIVFSYNNERYRADINMQVHRNIFFDYYDSSCKYYDEKGFDQYGFDLDGYDENGFNCSGYDKDGFNKDGFDLTGFNRDGLDRLQRDREGYDKTGFNASGFDRNNKYWVDIAKKLPNGAEEKIFSYLCTNKGILLTCATCSKQFFVSYDSIEFLKKKDYEIPKRCKKCREEKKKKIQSKGKYYGLEESRIRDNLIKTPTGREQHYRFFGDDIIWPHD